MTSGKSTRASRMASIFRRHAMISCAFVGLAVGPALAQLDDPPVTPNPALIASTKVDTKAIDGPWRDRRLSPERRADLILAQMTLDEKLIMLRGFSGGFSGGRSKEPLIGPMQRLTGNYVPGVPRLGIPALLTPAMRFWASATASMAWQCVWGTKRRLSLRRWR